MTPICIRVIRDLLDISREVILWEVREVTIDEYPVFLLHLSQPDLHMEYIPKGYLWKEIFSFESYGIWNTYQRATFRKRYPHFKALFWSLHFFWSAWNSKLLKEQELFICISLIQKENCSKMAKSRKIPRCWKYFAKKCFSSIQFLVSFFHDRRDIWSSVLRANQINSENGKNKANQPAASPDGFSMKSRPKKREIQSWKREI